MDPGFSDVCVKYANDYLFDKIIEVKFRDGGNLVSKDYDFVLGFSLWTIMDECLAPPLIWERSKQWYTTDPFSEPELYQFPDGIGTLECVNVEHEEIGFVPRYISIDKATFKYALGNEVIKLLKTLHKYNLTSDRTVNIKGVDVVPRDVVEICLPQPSEMLDSATGLVCVSTEVSGIKDGKHKIIRISQIMDNQEILKAYGIGVVGLQTASALVTAIDLLATGIWRAVGVHSPEMFDAKSYIQKYQENGFSLLIENLNETATRS